MRGGGVTGLLTTFFRGCPILSCFATLNVTCNLTFARTEFTRTYLQVTLFKKRGPPTLKVEGELLGFAQNLLIIANYI
jgi:hypothetical protein